VHGVSCSQPVAENIARMIHVTLVSADLLLLFLLLLQLRQLKQSAASHLLVQLVLRHLLLAKPSVRTLSGQSQRRQSMTIFVIYSWSRHFMC